MDVDGGDYKAPCIDFRRVTSANGLVVLGCWVLTPVLNMIAFTNLLGLYTAKTNNNMPPL